MIGSALYNGAVTHQRMRPVKHRLRYNIFMMLLDLDEVPALARRLFLFSHARFNLFAFHDADHGAGDKAGLRPWIEAQLRSAGLPIVGGAISILCMPRILGHAFNPISAFFCYGLDGRLAAMLYEVNNTFGERHTYLMPVTDDAGPIRQVCEKRFYVSPFMPMALQYASDSEGLMIATAFAGTRRTLTDRALLEMFLKMPFLGIKVLAGIHFEAARLWWRGLKLLPRPAPPADPVTITVQRSY
jgi:DUF1365 family protein